MEGWRRGEGEENIANQIRSVRQYQEREHHFALVNSEEIQNDINIMLDRQADWDLRMLATQQRLNQNINGINHLRHNINIVNERLLTNRHLTDRGEIPDTPVEDLEFMLRGMMRTNTEFLTQIHIDEREIEELNLEHNRILNDAQLLQDRLDDSLAELRHLQVEMNFRDPLENLEEHDLIRGQDVNVPYEDE